MSRVARRRDTKSRATRQARRRKVVQARRGFTRAKAERIIARAITLTDLSAPELSGHGNKHVVRKREEKTKRLANA